MRYLAYWFGVLAGAALVAGGVTIATLGYADTAGPEGAVRGYFSALAAGDAPKALAYGQRPAGSTAYLTNEVLRAQLRIAPLRDVHVAATQRHGNAASVQVKYTLAFAGADVPVSVTVPLHDTGGRWRLDRVAVPVELVAGAAAQRQSILGSRMPQQRVLLFPGALPIRLDTPYLKLDPFVDSVDFDSRPTVNVRLDVTAAGRSAFAQAVVARVRGCVGGAASAACPLPNERYVPRSVRGTVQGEPHAASTDLDARNPVGLLNFTGRVAVDGSYRRLDFHNMSVAGHGLVYLDVHAAAYAVAPLRLHWTSS